MKPGVMSGSTSVYEMDEVSGHWQNQKEELAIGSINEMAVQTWSDFVAAGGVSTVHGLETVATWLTGGVRKET